MTMVTIKIIDRGRYHSPAKHQLLVLECHNHSLGSVEDPTIEIETDRVWVYRWFTISLPNQKKWFLTIPPGLPMIPLWLVWITLWPAIPGAKTWVLTIEIGIQPGIHRSRPGDPFRWIGHPILADPGGDPGFAHGTVGQLAAQMHGVQGHSRPMACDGKWRSPVIEKMYWLYNPMSNLGY